MTTPADTSSTTSAPSARRGSPAVLGAALLGFVLISLDALIVTVALPDIGRSLGGGVSGLQWVVDGYTLMFAALMLSSGAGDRAVDRGRRRRGGTA